MRVLVLFFAALVLPTRGSTSPCTAQEISGLAEWKTWLSEENADMKEAKDKILEFKRAAYRAADAKEGAKVGAEIAELVGAAKNLRGLNAIRRSLTGKEVRPVPASVRRRMGDSEFDLGIAGELSELLNELKKLEGLDVNGLYERALIGWLDDIQANSRTQAQRLETEWHRRFSLYRRLNRMYAEANEVCLDDLEVVPRTALPQNPAPTAAADNSSPRRAPASDPNAVAETIVPIREADPPRVDLSALDRMVTPRGAKPEPAAKPIDSSPASSRNPATNARATDLNLDALDQMANSGSPPPSAPTSAQRPLSESAYLEACQGKEKSAACHRAHCLHVGAALNDKAWTQRCLRER